MAKHSNAAREESDEGINTENLPDGVTFDDGLSAAQRDKEKTSQIRSVRHQVIHTNSEGLRTKFAKPTGGFKGKTPVDPEVQKPGPVVHTKVRDKKQVANPFAGDPVYIQKVGEPYLLECRQIAIKEMNDWIIGNLICLDSSRNRKVQRALVIRSLTAGPGTYAEHEARINEYLKEGEDFSEHDYQITVGEVKQVITSFTKLKSSYNYLAKYLEMVRLEESGKRKVYTYWLPPEFLRIKLRNLFQLSTARGGMYTERQLELNAEDYMLRIQCELEGQSALSDEVQASLDEKPKDDSDGRVPISESLDTPEDIAAMNPAESEPVADQQSSGDFDDTEFYEFVRAFSKALSGRSATLRGISARLNNGGVVNIESIEIHPK